MDWKLVATTFATVFVAELGDKTQLATLSFSTAGTSRLSVFVGAALALVTTTAIAVVAGEAMTRFISPRTLQRLAGVLFLVIGGWVLWSTRA
ncbi:MAG: TMEM165/GDT1 family protein [Myxococcota bacterium]|jgi:putative Ca2+/H+ antiporter (TMEM165/GDT1 family)